MRRARFREPPVDRSVQWSDCAVIPRIRIQRLSVWQIYTHWTIKNVTFYFWL